MTKEKTKNPPKLAEWILRCVYPDRGDFTSVGDFREEYHEVYQSSGPFKANLWYWMQIAKSIPSFIRNKNHWKIVMIQNYLKIALRIIKRHKGYSFINIFGLAIGIACFILIMLYVHFEFSFDRFHKNKNTIYRIYVHTPGKEFKGNDYQAVTPAPLGPALMNECPEVVNATTTDHISETLLTVGEKRFIEDGIYADEHFLEMFTFPLESGDKLTALKQPYSIVISKNLAKRLFGNENPIGRTIKFDEKYDLNVTGVLKSIPDNSHLHFDFLISFCTYEYSYVNNWRLQNYCTYIELNKSSSYEVLDEKLSNIINVKFFSQENRNTFYRLQPLKDIHLKSHFNWDRADVNDYRQISLFAVIGFSILLIACINYINLSTAHSSIRTREIGLRKVVGANRPQLIRQFLGESVLFAVIGLLISLILVVISLPYYSAFLGKNLNINILADKIFILYLLGIVIFVGIIAGSYTAVYLSSFNTVKVLKGTFISGKKSSFIRNTLVVAQFTISAILIFCTIVILHQLHFVKNVNLGFNKENIVVFPVRQSGAYRNIEIIKNILKQNRNIANISVHQRPPTNITAFDEIIIKNNDGIDLKTSVSTCGVDFDFLKLYGIELLNGRDFSKEYGKDTMNAVILNETAVKTLGLKNPIGKSCSFGYLTDGQIIGVVKDFHFQPLYKKIEPMLLYINPNRYSHISVKIRDQNIQETLAFLKKTIEEYSPKKYHFTYYFLEEDYYAKYKKEHNFGIFFQYFSFLSILISCLGLFGLTSFTVFKRTKEIGIRKVLGASEYGILLSLSKEFIKWTFISNVIAWPIAYYAMNKWLQNFAYRINIGLGIFLASGMIALIIALLTVSYQSIKAATANPVDSLRYE